MSAGRQTQSLSQCCDACAGGRDSLELMWARKRRDRGCSRAMRYKLTPTLNVLLLGCVLLSLPEVNWSTPNQRCSSSAFQSGSDASCSHSPCHIRRRNWREVQGSVLADEQQSKRAKSFQRGCATRCSLRQLRGGGEGNDDEACPCRLHVKVADINCGQEGDIYVDVARNCSVGGLKEKIATQCNVSCSQQRLVHMHMLYTYIVCIYCIHILYERSATFCVQ